MFSSVSVNVSSGYVICEDCFEVSPKVNMKFTLSFPRGIARNQSRDHVFKKSQPVRSSGIKFDGLINFLKHDKSRKDQVFLDAASVANHALSQATTSMAGEMLDDFQEYLTR